MPDAFEPYGESLENSGYSGHHDEPGIDAEQNVLAVVFPAHLFAGYDRANPKGAAR